MLAKVFSAKVKSNAGMSNKDIRAFCSLTEDCLSLLKTAVVKMLLSARSYQRVIKLSRTIAGLEQSPQIKPNHIAESLQYRPKSNFTY